MSIIYERTEHGFWRQVNPEPFVYDEAYKARQGTNEAMSYLRLGWLAAQLGKSMCDMRVVDVGCGNGCFVRCAAPFFKSVCGYDVAGQSISRNELLETEWDLVICTDVLEHMLDMGELFWIHWRFAFISFPETPMVKNWEELRGWRHFKPNEHVWCLNMDGMKEWLNDHECIVVGSGHFEDCIRTRWNPEKPNISSILVRRIS